MDIIKIIEEAEDFPTLPSVTFQLHKLMSNPTVSLNSIAKLIENDSAIVTRILKNVNSSYNMLINPVSDIKHAVSILGIHSIQNIIMTLSFAKMFPIQKLPAYAQLFKRSLCAGVACDVLSDISGIKNRSDAFIASLLQNLGCFVFMYYLNDKYQDIIEEARELGSTLSGVEKNSLKLTNAHAAVIIAEKWNIPDSIILAIRYQNNIKLAHKKNLKSEVISIVEQSYLSGIAADIFTGWNKALKLAQFRREYTGIFNKYPSVPDANDVLASIPQFVQNRINSLNQNLEPVHTYDEICQEADFELELFMSRYNSLYNSFKSVENVFK